MANTIEIITQALQILRVVGANEAPDDDDARDALKSLNQMMRSWESSGRAMGWNTVDEVNDPLPAPDQYHEAIAYNLARRLQGLFGKQMSANDLQLAEDGLSNLRRDVQVANPMSPDIGPMGLGYYSIRGDYYYYGP